MQGLLALFPFNHLFLRAQFYTEDRRDFSKSEKKVNITP